MKFCYYKSYWVDFAVEHPNGDKSSASTLGSMQRFIQRIRVVGGVWNAVHEQHCGHHV